MGIIWKATLIISISCVLFLVCSVFYLNSELSSTKEKLAAYVANNAVLIDNIKKEHQNTLRLADEKKELETAIKADTSGFNWNRDIGGTAPVIELKRLHKNRDKVR